MNLSKRVDQWLGYYQGGTGPWLILNFLKHHAVGSKNAKTWNEIDQYLKKNAVVMRKQTFQQGLLKRSRYGDLFIGSNDNGESSGYFLIESLEDAQLMIDWYEKRIQVEQKHVNHLKQLCSNERA